MQFQLWTLIRDKATFLYSVFDNTRWNEGHQSLKIPQTRTWVRPSLWDFWCCAFLRLSHVSIHSFLLFYVLILS